MEAQFLDLLKSNTEQVLLL